MLVLHQVLIDSLHLFAGPEPVVRGSFLSSFDRDTAQHQTTLSNDPGILALVNDGSLIIRVFVRTDGFPSFTQLGEDVGLILFATHSDSNPAVHIAFWGLW